MIMVLLFALYLIWFWDSRFLQFQFSVEPLSYVVCMLIAVLTVVAATDICLTATSVIYYSKIQKALE